MDQGPMVTEQINAGAELIREFNKYAPVKTAFWVKESDAKKRYLYIASDQIDGSNKNLGYLEIIRLIRGQLKSPYLTSFRIKLINGESRMAREAWLRNQCYPNARIPLGEEFFGEINIDDGLIYPVPDLPPAQSPHLDDHPTPIGAVL